MTSAQMNGFSPESSVEPSTGIEQSRRRAYKACLHCRSRKAKCDLGDIDAPNQPPCARCKRERRECIFAPSYRGGKIVKKLSTSSAILGEPDRGAECRGTAKSMSSKSCAVFQKCGPNSTPPDYIPIAECLSSKVAGNENAGPRPVTFSNSDLDPDIEQDRRSRSDSEGPPRKTMRLDSCSGSDNAGDRDRLDPQSLAAASLRNPTDALNLLALAADVDRKNKAKRRDSRTSASETNTNSSPAHTHDGADLGVDLRLGLQTDDGSLVPCDAYNHPHYRHSQSNHVHRAPAPPSLGSYALLRVHALSPATLALLVQRFFARAHAVFPMVSHHRIPRCSVELARFAAEEEALLTAIVVIASRQEKMFDVHARSWEYMQTLINELILGKVGSVGTVEAMLLLSENLPRRPQPATEDEEHRMAWMLVGMAVRTGYMLGLDQKTLRPLTPGVEDKSGKADEPGENERLDRERLAWTYCYIFDRSISIRSGKAFWSRGPGLCFQRTHSGALPSASESFPSLRPIAGLQDDFSAMLQAYTELTQTMASAHDVLYPSKDRTIALVRVGDYHKYLDELTRSKHSKVWDTAIVTECVWISFHYTRLYIYAFAFQAHVQRCTSTSEDGKKIADNVIFPRGPMGSPDARFILEAIDAATELLHICVERLHPSGAMSYLPWRFFLYFQYAGVFLLKAVFVGAVVPQDQRAIVQLIKKVILCLACASPDEQHSGVRYARLLNGLLRVFSRGVDGVASQVGTPKRRALAELPAESSSASTPESGASATKSATQIAPTGGSMSSASTASSTVASSPSNAAPPATGSVSQSSTSLRPHEGHGHMHSPGTEAVLAHLPMPRLDVNTNFSGRRHAENTMQHRLISPNGAYYSSQMGSTAQSRNSAYSGGLPPPSYQHSHDAARHQRQHSQDQRQQHMYAQPPVQTHPSTNGYSNAGSGGNVGVDVNSTNFDMFQTSPGTTNFNFSQFDLNWPPIEPDGLAQMLADDHALDGDFWMSLPSHAQWQSWPQANTTPVSARQ
ncbi:hypothetical protein M0805_009406 [Coniferiporia weirii]|nr:hypothetical protein M0805_009406 [Coniferiporia weirii]